MSNEKMMTINKLTNDECTQAKQSHTYSPWFKNSISCPTMTEAHIPGTLDLEERLIGRFQEIVATFFQFHMFTISTLRSEKVVELSISCRTYELCCMLVAKSIILEFQGAYILG